MRKRCEELGCKKVARDFYNGKHVCREHTCRCNRSTHIAQWFNGCFIHKGE